MGIILDPRAQWLGRAMFLKGSVWISLEQLEEQICRPVVHLTQPDMDDYKTEAVTVSVSCLSSARKCLCLPRCGGTVDSRGGGVCSVDSLKDMGSEMSLTALPSHYLVFVGNSTCSVGGCCLPFPRQRPG